MKPTSSRSPALSGPIKQPTRWGCGEAGRSVYPAYRQSSMVGPNACTLQMDHLPTEDGGGSHSADQWYDVVRFTIARNSGSAMLHGTNQWPRDAKLREAAGSQWRASAEAYVCLARERPKCALGPGNLGRLHAHPRLGSHECREPCVRGEDAGHCDIRERVVSSTIVHLTTRPTLKWTRPSRQSPALQSLHSQGRANVRLGRALQDARKCTPRKRGTTESFTSKKANQARPGRPITSAPASRPGKGSGIVTDDMLVNNLRCSDQRLSSEHLTAHRGTTAHTIPS